MATTLPIAYVFLAQGVSVAADRVDWNADTWTLTDGEVVVTAASTDEMLAVGPVMADHLSDMATQLAEAQAAVNALMEQKATAQETVDEAVGRVTLAPTPVAL